MYNNKVKNQTKDNIYSTTVLAIRYNGEAVLAGDGQVTMGNTVIKHNARKIRRLYNGKVLTGFAGATVLRQTHIQYNH